MGELQPDLLGGKAVSGRRTPKARKNARIRVAPTGHADKPGTGPAGETCGGCSHMVDFHFRRTYHKCDARAGDVWKGGRATDVRPLDAACSKFCRKANVLPAAPTLVEAATQAGIEGAHQDIALANSARLLRAVDKALFSLCFIRATSVPTEIERALTNARSLGLTVDEISALIGEEPRVVRPRLSELYKAGKVHKAPERRLGGAGRTLAVWKIGGGNDVEPSLI